jgi:E3 ubiquitin-protein ligase TRIP12
VRRDQARTVALEADISSTIYQILTGVLPPSDRAASTNGVQGIGGVMQSLVHRPKEQVEEALSLVAELLLPLAKGKTFVKFSSLSFQSTLYTLF